MPTAIAGTAVLDGFASRLPCELYWWPGPKSYTGQPVAEFHTLGSRPLLQSLLAALGRRGARLAEPGEFTLRAFLSGRIDLTRAEAVLGVIDAADSRELDAALSQLAGGLAGRLDRLRDALLDLLADLEAGLDFADEEITFVSRNEMHRQLGKARQTVADLLRQMGDRGRTDELPRVVLVGWPNTGKSSLFNALVGARRALVSDQSGTTRDYVTAEVDLDGVRCVLIDTAGIEFPPDAGTPGSAQAPLGKQEDQVAIASAAQAISTEQARAAQTQLLCLDASRPLNAWEEAQLGDRSAHRILVMTKTDAPRRLDLAEPAVATSAATGEGIASLKASLRAALLAVGTACGSDDVVAPTAARCRESLRLAAEGLSRADAICRTDGGEELLAAELRFALDELGRIVGAVYTDDVLDRVFSRFCVGK